MQKSETFTALNGLRFLAALAVVIYHYGTKVEGYPRIPGIIKDFINLGPTAVSFFFILSGFVLAYRQLHGSSRVQTAGEFYWARFGRLYPAYLLAFLLFLPIALQKYILSPSHTIAGRHTFILSAVLSFLMLQSWTPLAQAWNGPSWSLSVEGFMYLLFPLIGFRLTRLNNGNTVFVLLVSWLIPLSLALAHVDHWISDVTWRLYIANNPLLWLPFFAMGICATRMVSSWIKVTNSRANMLSTSSFVALILVALLWPHGWTDIFVTGGIAPLLIAVTIFFTRISGWTTRIIGGPLLSKLGEASYVIYILQAPLWHYWQGLTNYLRQLPMRANTVEAWQFVGFLPFLVLTSLAVQHFIETPLRAGIRSWKKRDLAAQIQNKEELSRIANVKASKRISVDINFGRNNMHVTYSAAFFENQMNASYISAKTVMPHVISLCQPRSIADFGCGVGSWLRSCRECGITDITGVDGQYVEEQLLMIPQDNFVKADLTRPIDLHRRFDLVLSLEVAEHLPSDTASTFVDTLTRHAPIILFSAAVPSQGGVHHVNEQWGQYWQSAFAARDYACLDCLRDVFWDNRSIDWWYRQNMFLFVAESTLSEFPKLVEETARPRRLPLDLVHPGRPFEKQIGIRTLVRQLPGAIKFSLNRVMHMISGNSTPTN